MQFNFIKKKQGQASLAIAMMISTFLLFFMFVINTGMLVNAKINLQSAADMAAYAGAAVQARQLDQVAYLNYEMRRQYKKFLFRYYVIGNMSQKSFRSAGPNTPRVYSPDDIPGNDFTVPAVCIPFKEDDNYCQVPVTPKISIPASSPLDAINQTLIGQLQQLESLRQCNCSSIGAAHQQLLLLWLYNTDPQLGVFEAALAGVQNNTPIECRREVTDTLKILKFYAEGLGLLPKEILLRARISTLEYYLNKEPAKNLTNEIVNGMSGDSGKDTAALERTIQAYKSAFQTLGPNSFTEDSLTMDELLPLGSDNAARMIQLNNLNVTFDTYYIATKEKDDPDPKGRDCNAKPFPFSVNNPIPIGVTKDPSTLTYYAVRLKAKARILFSPFGDLELKAYSAAQPFGSRVAPGFLREENFVRKNIIARFPSPNSTDQPCSQTTDNCVGQIPNLPIKEADGTSKGQGWDDMYIQFKMFDLFKDAAASVSGARRLSLVDLHRAYEAAMAPNPWERGKFQIHNDLPDSFQNPMDSIVVPGLGERKVLAFWAPVFSSDKSGTGQDGVTDQIRNLINAIPDNDLGVTDAAKLKEAFLSGFNTYLSRLKSANGELGDGFNVVKLFDPLSTYVWADGTSDVRLPADIAMKSAQDIKTSWNNVKDVKLRTPGRTGYSVKYVSFKTLTGQTPYTTDGSSGFSNIIPPDFESEDDFRLLQH